MATAYEKVQESRKQLVQKVIDNIESGHELLWIKAWNCDALRPQNAVTNANYLGSNRLRLSFAAIENGYDDPRWVTFNQAKNQGWQVRKGQKGVLLEKWIFDIKEKVRDENGNIKKDENGQDIERIKPLDRPIINYFVVFNAKQIDGIPELKLDKPDYSKSIEIADNFIKSSECKVSEIAQERAFYSPSTDEIVLPLRDSFKSYDDFLSTALHEMVHSTGHKSRLNRDMSGFFGSESYAREELIAELGAMFTQANLSIEIKGQHFENHSAYLKSWLEVLKKDHNELFKAADKASKASELLYNNYLKYSKDLTQDHNSNKTSLNQDITEQKFKEAVKKYVISTYSDLPLKARECVIIATEKSFLQRVKPDQATDIINNMLKAHEQKQDQAPVDKQNLHKPTTRER